MKMIRTIGAFLFAANALSANTEILSLRELNDAFEGVASLKIGFLSQGNYDSIKSVLPKQLSEGGKLVVDLSYPNKQDLEDAVVAGDVIAGCTTSPPADARDKLNVFGAGLVTTRASFFKLDDDSDSMRQAFDAALVRMIASGEYEAIKEQYFLSNGFSTISALTCSTDEDSFPFPKYSDLVLPNDVLKAAIDSGELKVGSKGAKNNSAAQWGYQGDYTKTPPSGFWPDFEAAIFQKIIDQYPTPSGDNMTITRVWRTNSSDLMDAVIAGDADLTAPYWTVPAFHEGESRHYRMSVSCTTLGTEQQFFTRAAPKTEIVSLRGLNIAFDSVVSHKIGFLSQGNYDSIQSVLPKQLSEGGKLVVDLSYPNLQDLEDAVVAGDVIAGCTTSPPADAKGKLNVFGAGLVTTRASFFKLGDDSISMRQAFDAALVRVIASGEYETIKEKYFLSNGYSTISALTCSTDEDSFPYPEYSDLVLPNDVLKAAIDSGELKVGSKGAKGNSPAHWGYQGDYTKDPPSGFWPDFEAKIYDKIIEKYAPTKTMTITRVWRTNSSDVMDAVIAGDADMIAPYWTVPAFHEGDSRHYKMSVSCTTLGTEQQFFTLAAQSPKIAPAEEDSVPIGVITGIAISIVVALMAIILICFMIKKEKKGQPLFTPLIVNNPAAV